MYTKKKIIIIIDFPITANLKTPDRSRLLATVELWPYLEFNQVF